MRVAIDAQALAGQKTGIGHYMGQLLAALRAVAPDEDLVEIQPDQARVMRTDRRIRWQQWELPRRARSARADLLHVTGFDGPVWKPLPVVLTVHDLIGMILPGNLPPVSRLYWARWLPFTVRFADRIVAVSECTRRDIQRLLGIPADRIDVVHSGVDPAFRLQPAADLAAGQDRYGLTGEFILYLGTLEPRKGIDTLIEAFARLAAAGLPHRLVIAGRPGWSWQSLIDLAAARGLGDRVRFLDYVPDEDRARLYGAAAVFAFPSRYEGFGLPVVEAMACGTPVVCSDAAALPEVAGGAAVLVPPDQPVVLAEAIAGVLKDPGRAADLRDRGLRRAAELTWDRTARSTLEVYRRTLRDRAARGRQRRSRHVH